jgi:hypothetical protein
MCVSLLLFFRGEGGADSMQEHPKIRTDCEASPACAPMKHHFEKCHEKDYATRARIALMRCASSLPVSSSPTTD